jgi:4-oxalocrotonate tautomerase
MPIVTVLQGPRDSDVKRELLRRITDAFVEVNGMPADAIQVWFQDTAADSWGIGHKLFGD